MTQNTVLITGASGFIGKHVVRALAASGWAVRAAARDPAAIPVRAGVERVALPDLARPADWSKLVDGVSHIVHLAGIAHAPGRLPDEVYARINTDAVGELAQAARGRVERLVLMSSVRAQAGLAADHVITEKDAARPTDAYGHSKLAAERLLKECGAGFTVLRPTVVYGKGAKGNIASLATLAQTPMPLPFGGLDNRRSLLALENLAAAIALVLTSPQAEGETFLVADSEFDQRGGVGLRHARRTWPGTASCARAGRSGEAADGHLWQGGRMGTAVGELRHRRREASRHRLDPAHQDARGHRHHDAHD